MDVARHAGVAKSTVSFVLNGKKNINTEIKKRIFTAIKQLEYQPSTMAKLLKNNRTMQIGVVVDDVTNPAAGIGVDSISHQLKSHGYQMLLGLVPKEADLQTVHQYLKNFSFGMVDGIINMSSIVGLEEAENLCKNVPTVTFRRVMRNGNIYDLIDFASAILKCMENLTSLGHAKIGILVCDNQCPDFSVTPIETGYREFCAMGKLSLDENMIERVGVLDSNAEHGARLLEAGATAIIASSDLMAANVIQLAYKRRLKIPDDFSLIGLEDTMLTTLTTPNLTSLQMPNDAVAELTVRQLLSKINDEKQIPPESIIPKLIVRDSTGPAPARPKHAKRSHMN